MKLLVAVKRVIDYNVNRGSDGRIGRRLANVR